MNNAENRTNLHRFGAAVLLTALNGSALAVNDTPLIER